MGNALNAMIVMQIMFVVVFGCFLATARGISGEGINLEFIP
jgi:hypothetical protein